MLRLENALHVYLVRWLVQRDRDGAAVGNALINRLMEALVVYRGPLLRQPERVNGHLSKIHDQ